MEPQRSPGAIGREWGKYVLERWAAALEKYDVGGGIPGDLAASFRALVEESGEGNLAKIELSYLYYGLFVDAGLGKGVKSGDQKDLADSRRLLGKLRGNARTPKPWLSKTTPGQLNKLGDLLQIDAGERAGRILMQTLPRDLDIPL